MKPIAGSETPWEKGIPHPALVDFLAENGPLTGEICVPGCGSGHDVRALSTPSNHVLGIDLATRAIATANSQPRIANEEYLLADLFNCRRNSIASSIGFLSTPAFARSTRESVRSTLRRSSGS
jgi:hypothetical protein